MSDARERWEGAGKCWSRDETIYLCHFHLLPQQQSQQLGNKTCKGDKCYWGCREISCLHFVLYCLLPVHNSDTLVQLQFMPLSAESPWSVTHMPVSLPETERTSILVCVCVCACVYHVCVPGILNNLAVFYKPGKLMLQQPWWLNYYQRSSVCACVCVCVCVCLCLSPFGQSLQTQPVRLSMESPTHRSHDWAWEQSVGETKLAFNLMCLPETIDWPMHNYPPTKTF